MMIIGGFLLFGIGASIFLFGFIRWVGGMTCVLAVFINDMLHALGMRPIAVGLRWVLTLWALAIVGGTFMIHDGKDPHNFMTVCVWSSFVAAGVSVVWQIKYWADLILEEVSEPEVITAQTEAGDYPWEVKTLVRNSKGVYVASPHRALAWLRGEE